jgi:peroxiredoxin Q/BCP
MFKWWFTPPLPVGTPAPDFSLPDQDGSRMTLSALRGKNVILVFYPADDTSVCTKQLCEFRDQWENVLARNAVLFGMNNIRFRPKAAFHKKFQFPFPLLYDQGQQVAQQYQSNGLAMKFPVRRTVYLIGPDGVIRYARRGKPLPEEVLASAA